MSGPLSGKKLLLAFRASLLLKGSFAAAEVAAGFMAYLVPPGLLLRMAQIVTRTELMEDPGDFFAVHLLGAAQGYHAGSQRFVVFYLLGHGLLKLCLVVILWQRRVAFFPPALGVFGLFILFQAYRFCLTGSPLLLLITILDGVMVWLIWAEYRALARSPSGARC